jgi:3-oxosteroid 1-dehydrogenase
VEQVSGTWDEVVDVVVVGTGATGLTAAVRAADAGASVLIVEKSTMIGGTSAVSGGVVWVPMNHHLGEVGIEDNREDALAYVTRLSSHRAADPALIELCVDRGPEMLAYLESNTPLKMVAMQQFADYYDAYDFPGKRPGGRSCEPLPFPVGREMPEWSARIQSKVAIRGQAARAMVAEDYGQLTRAPGELERRDREDERTKGSGLVASIFKGVLNRGIEVRMETKADQLVGNTTATGRANAGANSGVNGLATGLANGRVEGIRLSNADGSTTTVKTNQGVVLASGGFEWNRELVEAFIGYELFPVSPQHNTGDGLLMGMEAGALLGNMHSFWGTGAMVDPSDLSGGMPLPTFDEARAGKGTFIVNRNGKRFVNEAAPYHDFAKAFGAFDPSTADFPNEKAWMIFDSRLRETKQLLSMKPTDPTPDWVMRGDTIEDLACVLSISPVALSDTLHRFNAYAEAGHDPEFDRPRGMKGSKIGPVVQPPYYAVRIYPGTLGTNGGLRTNEYGQVRQTRGGTIEGLYAVGNVAASPLGWGYPGGGATLWIGMTMAYLAGDHVARSTPPGKHHD